jgi:hypothetical protein
MIRQNSRYGWQPPRARPGVPPNRLLEREQRAVRKLEQLDRGDLQGVPVYVASHIHAQVILLV